MTYAEKLQTPAWFRFRDALIRERGGHCEQCGTDEALQVHHITYVRGMEPWDYPGDLLLVLCRECHLNRQVHDEEARFEFSRVCGRMASWEVYELSKALRRLVQSDDVKRFDAYEAIASADDARKRRVAA